jgi:hypothetical protein
MDKSPKSWSVDPYRTGFTAYMTLVRAEVCWNRERLELQEQLVQRGIVSEFYVK